MTSTNRLFAVAVATALVIAACGGGDLSDGPGGDDFDPGGCVVVDMAASPEKIDLITELANTFNDKREEVEGTCVLVRAQKKSSGVATSLLAEQWDENTDGPKPVIWSPAASSWGAILNQRLADRGEAAMSSPDAQPFMLTPLVIAMPKPMASALGYPDKAVSWADILRLARDPQGWAALGHPEWGPFRLGKTNPNFSTSGLSALIAQNYAAVGKTQDLTVEDLADPATLDFNRGIESAVVHYGDITMTFLNNWFRADRRGTALTYASAVAVEEKSVIDYNAGNPDGITDPGEEPRTPKTPLVSIYPTEGTLYSDSPFFILDAPWVSAEEKAAAKLFQDFVQEPANQRKVLDFGFRPANPKVAVAAPIVAKNGVDPNQPTTLLQVPQPKVMVDLLGQWAQNRKTARVLMVLDVSGSMGEPAGSDTDETKLELAKRAAINALDDFKDDDEVGLRIFSTNLGPNEDQNALDLVPMGPIGTNREKLKRQIDNLIPTNGTPLYDVSRTSYQEVLDGYDESRINAVLLLTDGHNDDGDTSDDDKQQTELLREVRAGSAGENSKPVRVFTIGYGADADMTALRALSEASNAAAYNATDASSINQVFTQVVSNF
ncbi:MAG: extracellular solute-binding protein [Microthrixaceae bacterium]|nr:extracellular solute-binding protein [Microthrixaceae bacterium]